MDGSGKKNNWQNYRECDINLRQEHNNWAKVDGKLFFRPGPLLVFSVSYCEEWITFSIFKKVKVGGGGVISDDRQPRGQEKYFWDDTQFWRTTQLSVGLWIMDTVWGLSQKVILWLVPGFTLTTWSATWLLGPFWGKDDEQNSNVCGSIDSWGLRCKVI